MRFSPLQTASGTPATDTYTAGESATSHSVVALTGGKVYRASTASTPGSVVGIIQTGMTANALVEVFTRPQKIAGFSGLTPDADYYVGATAGSIVTPAPSSGLIQRVGVATDDTTLSFDLDSGNTRYFHNQSSPSATWTITHSLDRRPTVIVIDSANTVLDAAVSYPSASVVVVTFSGPTSGTAYLN